MLRGHQAKQMDFSEAVMMALALGTHTDLSSRAQCPHCAQATSVLWINTLSSIGIHRGQVQIQLLN